MTTALARISTRFAAELLELTNAIERGEDVEHRIRVLHEYARTWMVVAEHTAPAPTISKRTDHS